MVLLESYDRFDDLAELEPVTGQLYWYSKRDSPEMTARPIQGAISRLDGHVVSLYRQKDVLHFRVDDVDIELTDDIRIEYARDATNILTVLRGNTSILCFEYEPYVADEVDQWRMYLDPFIHEEHFDFGLFVYTVTQNTDQRNAIYR